MTEEAILFGASRSLVGIVSTPAVQGFIPARPAVILLNPGIVHRVGPGRIYVQIARALAERGFIVFRFDLSGIGDSSVRQDNLPFEQSRLQETQQAMDLLEETHGVQQFVLMGGCSGARIALETACRDPRVVGVVPINFPVLDEDNEPNAGMSARRMAHYYWTFALFNLSSWHKLLTGKANYRNVCRALRLKLVGRLFRRETKPTPEAVQFIGMLRVLVQRRVRPIFVYSASDPRLEELREIGGRELQRSLAQHHLQLRVIPRSDHTFSALQDQQRLIQVICEMADALSGTSRPADTLLEGGGGASRSPHSAVIHLKRLLSINESGH